VLSIENYEPVKIRLILEKGEEPLKMSPSVQLSRQPYCRGQSKQLFQSIGRELFWTEIKCAKGNFSGLGIFQAFFGWGHFIWKDLFMEELAMGNEYSTKG